MTVKQYVLEYVCEFCPNTQISEEGIVLIVPSYYNVTTLIGLLTFVMTTTHGAEHLTPMRGYVQNDEHQVQ